MSREFQISPDFKAAVLANGSAGSSGQVLASQGSGLPPQWTTPASTVGSSATGLRNITTSTSDPSGGSDGDIWIKYTA